MKNTIILFTLLLLSFSCISASEKDTTDVNREYKKYKIGISYGERLSHSSLFFSHWFDNGFGYRVGVLPLVSKEFELHEEDHYYGLSLSGKYMLITRTRAAISTYAGVSSVMYKSPFGDLGGNLVSSCGGGAIFEINGSVISVEIGIGFSYQIIYDANPAEYFAYYDIYVDGESSVTHRFREDVFFSIGIPFGDL